MNLLVGIAAMLSLALGTVIAVLAATSSLRHVRWAHPRIWYRSGAPTPTYEPSRTDGGPLVPTSAVASSSVCFVWQWMPADEQRMCPSCTWTRRAHRAGAVIIVGSVFAMALSSLMG